MMISSTLQSCIPKRNMYADQRVADGEAGDIINGVKGGSSDGWVISDYILFSHFRMKW